MPALFIDREPVPAIGRELRRRNGSILEISDASQGLHLCQKRFMAFRVFFNLEK